MFKKLETKFQMFKNSKEKFRKWDFFHKTCGHKTIDKIETYLKTQ